MARTIPEAFNLLHGWQGLTRAQAEAAATHERGLWNHFEDNYETLFGVFAIGSYDRGTICAGERDIDLMACLRGYGPGQLRPRFQHDSSRFLYWIRDDLNEHYHRTDVSSKQVCVKLDFSDIVTDVIPCFWNPDDRDGYWMPDGHGGWMLTNPPFHARLIADSDRAKANRLKPVIRLVKAWNIANGHHLSSFHLEMMIEEAQRPYQIYDHAFEVWWTMRSLAWLLAYRFADPWGPGGYIDDYLTDDERARAIRMLTADAERANQAREYEAAGKIEDAFARWDTVYNGAFPAYY